MKEILKEIAPGVFTHSHWEDEEGNVIEFVSEVQLADKEVVSEKLSQLEDMLLYLIVN